MRVPGSLFALATLAAKVRANAPPAVEVPCQDDELGNGYCNAQSQTANTESCGWDGGDCCAVSCISTAEYTCGMGSDGTTVVPYNFCDDPNNQPGCEQIYQGTENLGNGLCDNTLDVEICGWDGGDCCESSCVTGEFTCGSNAEGTIVGFPLCTDPSACEVPDFTLIGNGFCDLSGAYNTEACSWDGGDCCGETCVSATYTCGMSIDGSVTKGYRCQNPEYLILRPSVLENCTATVVSGYMNSVCDESLNLLSCNWDGGDCCAQTCQDTDSGSRCRPTDTYNCLDPVVMGLDYGATCAVESFSYLNDGYCDDIAEYNIAACSWDGGDCCASTCNDTVPFVCGVESPLQCLDPTSPDHLDCPADDIRNRAGLGNGICDLTGASWDLELNTAVCNWDNGDCCPSTCTQGNETCENLYFTCLDPQAADTGTQGGCVVEFTSYIGDGACDFSEGAYNTERCGWDGGDCCASTCNRELNPITSYTCGARHFECLNPAATENSNYTGPCQATPLSRIGDAFCDTDAVFNSRRCSWDGGDCCPQTCASNTIYTCGRGYETDEFGEITNPTLTYIGYPTCVDPVYALNTTTTMKMTTTTVVNTSVPGIGFGVVATGADGGAIAGAVVGVLVVLGIVGVLVWFFVIKKTNRRYTAHKDAEEATVNTSEMPQQQGGKLDKHEI